MISGYLYWMQLLSPKHSDLCFRVLCVLIFTLFMFILPILLQLSTVDLQFFFPSIKSWPVISPQLAAIRPVCQRYRLVFSAAVSSSCCSTRKERRNAACDTAAVIAVTSPFPGRDLTQGDVSETSPLLLSHRKILNPAGYISRFLQRCSGSLC